MPQRAPVAWHGRKRNGRDIRKALRSRLDEMERAGLVTRRLLGDERRREEYSLTLLGETLKPIVGGMYEWGLRNQAPTRIAMSARPAEPGAV